MWMIPRYILFQKRLSLPLHVADLHSGVLMHLGGFSSCETGSLGSNRLLNDIFHENRLQFPRTRNGRVRRPFDVCSPEAGPVCHTTLACLNSAISFALKP